MPAMLEVGARSGHPIKVSRSKLRATPDHVLVAGLAVTDVRVKSMKSRPVYLKLSTEEAEALWTQLSDLLADRKPTGPEPEVTR